jgi:hypothetical protein
MFTKQVSMFVLAALLLLTSCSAPAQTIQGEHWVIFSETLAEEQQLGTSFLFGDEPIEYWTPSEQDVIAIENGLVAYLEQNAERFYVRDIPVWERLDDYNRQYVGVIIDNRRIVYANYFCDSVVDWEKEFVIVMDGGDCFFQFQFDVDTAEFFELQVNGEA